jgi:phosphohistidine swiveling domain-containing protein
MTTVGPVSSGARLVRPLRDESDVKIVGGKASALGRAMRAGLRVPAGFAITTAAFDDHLDRLRLRGTIDALCAQLDSRDHAGMVRISNDIRSLIVETHLSEDLREELFASADDLLACGMVVVRSSAIGEDSRDQSFAGQLDSILHVSTLARLEEAVLECWASFWSARALFYRAARDAKPSGMGVVVQQQVEARSAGVLFTDAGAGDILVEYANGLADALVSGAVEPNRISIDRRTRTIRGHSMAGGADRMGDRVIAKLVDSAIDLEREFAGPQDVEWAVDDDERVWIVQSRPITAPILPPGLVSSGARRISWSNANVNENFPGPISPFLYSIAAPGYTSYFRNLAHAFGISRARIRAMEPSFRQIIGVHGARMYYNLTAIHSILRLAPFGRDLSKSFDTFVGSDGSNVELESLDRRSKARQMLEVTRIALRTTGQYLRLPRRIERFESTVDQLAAATHPTRLADMSGVQLRDALRSFVDIRCNQWVDASLADCAAMVCYGALERLLRLLKSGNGGSAEHTALLKAIPDVISGEPVRRLWALSRTVRGDKKLASLFANENSSVILATIRDDVSFGPFARELDAYLEEWGFRCSEELMLTSPSFQEDPEPLLDMIRAYARLDAGSPDDALRDQEASRLDATRRVMRELGWKGAMLRVVLPWTHAAIRFRERARMKQALLYSRCRRIALAIGECLVARGTLSARGDVFFLTVHEIDELLSGSAMLPDVTRATVALRRRAHEKAGALTVPDAFTLGEGEYFDGDGPALSSVCEDIELELRGTPACTGRVTGRATVLRDVTEAARLSQGDILVTRQTDPGWGPVFFLISGLVIERGGMLSHGAIIAREFGIPCVVGVRNAMTRIEDGTMITVDADAGVIHVCV